MKILFSLIFLVALSAQAVFTGVNKPELPRVSVDTRMPIQTGVMTLVAQGGDLQKAINEASPGDTIVLAPGSIFVGNYTLPAKNNPGNKWVVIRGGSVSGEAAPEGIRADPIRMVTAPKIISPNSSSVFATQLGASYYRLVGLNIGLTDTNTLNYGLVEFGLNTAEQSSLEKVSHHLIVDRCYIHGTPTSHSKRGVNLNSGDSAVIDSYISDIHGWGQDTQAIGGANGPGPFKIFNNYLEAAGENIIFGGDDPKIAGLVPSDIEIKRNYLVKPLSWRAPVPGFESKGPWLVKNLFELKNAKRVLVEGNQMENSWKMGQTGFAILLTPRNQGGKCTWCTVQDVTFRNNLVEHAGSGVSLLGTDYNSPSGNLERIFFENNLFNDMNGKVFESYGTCVLATLKNAKDIVFDHNSCFQTQHIFYAGQNRGVGLYDTTPGFAWTNNMTNHNDYGIFGESSSIGAGTISNYFPGGKFTRNVIIRNLPGVPKTSQYPKASLFPDVSGESFILLDKLADAPKDIGADADAIRASYEGKVEAREFTPTVPSDWKGAPKSFAEALNELASRVRALELK